MKASEGDQRIERLDRLADLLDESIRIPVIGYRIGYDAIIGLIPGIGDLAGLALSSYIVVEAARYKLPKSTLLRMVTNVAIEAVVGSIPLIGDVFDATYKANLRNLRLLHKRLDARETAPREDKTFFMAVIAIPVVTTIALAAALVWLLTLIF